MTESGITVFANDEIHLVTLNPSRSTTGSVKEFSYILERITFDNVPVFELLVSNLLIQYETTQQVSVNENGEPRFIDPRLKLILETLSREASIPRRIWVEDLCMPENKDWSFRREELKKAIHFQAVGVIVWIGLHHEETDFLVNVLGKGRPESTAIAFEFAHDMATAPPEAGSLELILGRRVAENGPRAWCYLARLLYRSWFRKSPLLLTRYWKDLENVCVRCESASTSMFDILAAAERVRIIQPLPATIEDSYSSPSCLEAFLETWWSRLSAWIHARETFGFCSMKFLAQVMSLSRNTKKAGDGQGSPSENLAAILGFLGDAMNVTISELSDRERLKLDYFVEIFEQRSNDAEFCLGGTIAPLPTIMSMKGSALLGRLSSPPAPEHQASFVYTPLRNKDDFRLLEVMPHQGNTMAPLQCNIFHVSQEEIPPFLYILNASLKNYRHKALILVNNQALEIAKPVEVFLRFLQQETKVVTIFLFDVCVERDHDMEGFIRAQKYLSERASYFGKSVAQVDMYEILDLAAETERQVGHLPLGMTEDEWLLDLLDEEDVAVPPLSVRLQKEDQAAVLRQSAKNFLNAGLEEPDADDFITFDVTSPVGTLSLVDAYHFTVSSLVAAPQAVNHVFS